MAQIAIDDRRSRVEAAAKAERKRISAAIKKPRRTHTVTVHNPYGHGIDRVEKIFDQLAMMAKRKQITEQQYQAGQRLQIAHDTVHGSVGGSMDFERARGGGIPGQMPALPYMLAAETLSQAKMRLYPKDHEVVKRVCLEGERVDQCAWIFDGDRRETGRALRRGLGELAELWWPTKVNRRGPSFYRADKAMATDVQTVIRGGTYHAK